MDLGKRRYDSMAEVSESIGSVDQRGANQSEVSMARDLINSPINSQGDHETPLAEGGGRGAVKGDQLRGVICCVTAAVNCEFCC
jgi:hypothetical protein